MKDKIIDSIGKIDDDMIESVDALRQSQKKPSTKKNTWVKWSAIAACLCLIAIGTVHFSGNRIADSEVQQWSQSISAKDYFKNSRNGNSQEEPSSSASLVMPPYAVAVSLNSERSELEKGCVLPTMPDHPEHSFQAEYNGDGSLYKVSFLWMRRGEHGLDEYSDLKLIAAPKERHEISDKIMIQIDQDGNAIPDDVTVTQRDGIQIFAKGKETAGKAITWQTEQGWYQITGSWNDSYEDMVALLDWFWAHPLSLSRFETPDDETFVFSSRTEQPDAFREQIPDFSALGYTAEVEHVNIGPGLYDKNPVPVWFEGIYSRGEAQARWTISLGADADAWSACLGRPNEVTEEMVNEVISQNQCLNLFFDVPCMATLTIEQGTSADAWEIIQTLQR